MTKEESNYNRLDQMTDKIIALTKKNIQTDESMEEFKRKYNWNLIKNWVPKHLFLKIEAADSAITR